ncbi:hypothetical protein Zmor_023931 [Zophobas morio]|uniref:Uncharacterized protein n=1 Tax=Zophobas morio TaxID=2755281 RepID=A0AA38HZE9_9CUCU|nr:hypothetical protein Zmor_023931 [Zophobas morio]
MSIYHISTLLLVVVLVVQDILCFCEESHVIICDDLADVKQNETTPWHHVQIGSLSDLTESPKHSLNSSVLFDLHRTKSLTIINQIRLIQKIYRIAHISYLKYLNLYRNNILEITDAAFSEISSLREVYLKNNNIQHLGRGIFENLTLDIIDLSWNHIHSVTTGFYNTKIKWLLLNHNEINFIGYEPFPSSLQQLELSNNQLESLDKHAFQNLQKLKELYLNHNRLTTVPDIATLKQIQYLHFAHNKIEEVHFRFDKFRKLSFVDLSFNIIKNVTSDVFASNDTPAIVVLSFNRLTNMVFEHPEKRTDLGLLGNPWNCNCWSKIENILGNYNHDNTCEFNSIFNKGTVPFCIESGECGGSRVISESEIDNFLDAISICEDKIKICNFRL